MSDISLENLSYQAHDILEPVAQAATPDLYSATLICQARVCYGTLMEKIRKLSIWERQNKILEIGCGTGEFAKCLSQSGLLNNSSYTGIDIEEAFVKKATARNLRGDIEFLHKNLFMFEGGEFDVTISIAVLQHLGPIENIFAKLLQLLKKDGYLLLFDAVPGKPAQLEPDIPLIKQIFEQISYQSTSGKRNDRCLSQALEMAPQFGLKVLEVAKLEIAIESSLIEDYVRLNILTSELIKRFYSVNIDQQELLKQLMAWRSSGGTATIHGWGQLFLQRHAAP